MKMSDWSINKKGTRSVKEKIKKGQGGKGKVRKGKRRIQQERKINITNDLCRLKEKQEESTVLIRCSVTPKRKGNTELKIKISGNIPRNKKNCT